MEKPVGVREGIKNGRRAYSAILVSWQGFAGRGEIQVCLNQLLKEFRKTLDDSSPLAKSIGDNAPSRTKAIIADKENYPQLAEILFLDTLEGDKRKEERRLALGRRQEGRRKTSLTINPDKRQTPRRSEMRRDSLHERRRNQEP